MNASRKKELCLESAEGPIIVVEIRNEILGSIMIDFFRAEVPH